MTLKLTAEIVKLQEAIMTRLAELGYSDSTSSQNLSRQLASIAVLGNSFSRTTLPLFLTLESKHKESLAQLAISMKCDLEEIGDAVSDVDVDMRALMQHLETCAQ